MTASTSPARAAAAARRSDGRDSLRRAVCRVGGMIALAALSACGGGAAEAPAPDAAGLAPLFASMTPAQTQGLPLSLIVQPMSLAVEEGAPATFVAVAEGAPPLHYQWLRDGVPVAGAHGPVLRFSAARGDDGARLEVVVSNAADTLTSWPATLSVAAEDRSHSQQ